MRSLLDSRIRENDGKRAFVTYFPPTIVTLAEKRGSMLRFHHSLDSRIRENDEGGTAMTKGTRLYKKRTPGEDQFPGRQVIDMPTK
jgi:hypothetical protein